MNGEQSSVGRHRRGEVSDARSGRLGATLSTPSSAELTFDQSFSVHLGALEGIGREIGTQFDGLQKPQSDLAQMLAAPLNAGSFNEAGGLGQANATSTTQMEQLLDQVKAALQFADEVTTAVANGYRSADNAIAQSLGLGSSLGGTVDGTVGGTIGGTVDSLSGTTVGLIAAVVAQNTAGGASSTNQISSGSTGASTGVSDATGWSETTVSGTTPSSVDIRIELNGTSASSGTGT